MRVLVTGGTGYLGRAVVNAIAANGHTPVVFARTASAMAANDYQRTKVIADALARDASVRIFKEDWSLDSAAAIRDLGHRIRPLDQSVAELVASL